jgi:hypothetical protein
MGRDPVFPDSVLPEAVRIWIGFNTRAGRMDASDNNLASYNDSGMSFDEIADLIESEPEGLFVKETYYPDWGIDWEDVERWEQDHEKDEGYED